MRIAAATTTLLLVAACKSTEPPPKPVDADLSGEWEGPIVNDFTFVHEDSDISLAVSDDDGSLSGSAKISRGGFTTSKNGSLRGRSSPDIRVSLGITNNYGGAELKLDCTYEAEVNDDEDRLEGTLTCKCLELDVTERSSLTLEKQ